MSCGRAALIDPLARWDNDGGLTADYILCILHGNIVSR